MNEYAVFELYVEQLWSFPLKNVCLEMPKRAQSKLYSDLFVFYLIFFFYEENDISSATVISY